MTSSHDTAERPKDGNHASTASPMPKKETLEAISEEERIARDPNVKGYRDMKELINALNS
ncbi:MAG: hypothetical protein MJ202_03585 [Lentisphaeria bacterium]|nr:hypothetical protein [Lentisphaeria bacterium]